MKIFIKKNKQTNSDMWYQPSTGDFGAKELKVWKQLS